KIRGELSEGMICAEDEIGTGTSHEGIIVLEKHAKTGTPAKEYFNVETDTVFEIGLTPNRIDAASHFGVARDLAASLGQNQKTKLKKPAVDDFKIDNDSYHIDVDIYNKEACKRYSGITISGIHIKESPAWLKNRLLSIDLKPINNIVDVTNFVLHEIGQPLHAFDADRITGKKVIIKTLADGTRFRTLDDVERSLTASDLMICNAAEGMCIAGVFGGTDSGIKDSTVNVFLESACFNPRYIRTTSRHHQLFTDSSFRFERGSDPNITIYALKRAAMMIKQLAGGLISSEIVDVYPEPVTLFPVELNFSQLDRLTGNVIDRDLVRNILSMLDIRIAYEKDGKLNLQVPTYRTDVLREADVIEEILRIYGFNFIYTNNQISMPAVHSARPDEHKVKSMIANMLVADGYFEIMSNSITNAIYYTSGLSIR
ncbi:MAG: phenylalanine--tRNA ligase subunit beta, partial [Bacteroidia bacterium]|nr:phenylalanine--tRNA ligase subunit beta [Bacteroidia bacterium]